MTARWVVSVSLLYIALYFTATDFDHSEMQAIVLYGFITGMIDRYIYSKLVIKVKPPIRIEE